MLFLPIWFDESAPKGEMTVICTPVDNESTALAVLKGAAHVQKPALIVSGEGGGIQRFIDAVEILDERWQSVQDAIPSMTDLARQAGLDVPWMRRPASVEAYRSRPELGDEERPRMPRGGLLARVEAARRARAAADVPAPKAGLYPKHIAKAAKPLWDLVVTEQKRRINDAGKADIPGAEQMSPNQKKWAMALILWKRKCAQPEYRISPFDHSAQSEPHRERTASGVVKRMQDAYRSAEKVAGQILRDLKKAKLIESYEPDEFYEATVTHGSYYLRSRQTYIAHETKTIADVMQWLVAKKFFARSSDYLSARFTVNNMTYLTHTPDPTGNDAAGQITISLHLTRDEVCVLTGRDDASPTETVAALERIGDFWFRTGRLNIKKALESE